MVECEDDQLQDVCHDPMIVQVALMTGPVYQPLRQPNTDTTHITEEESFLILTSMPGLNGQSVSLGVKYYSITVLQYQCNQLLHIKPCLAWPTLGWLQSPTQLAVMLISFDSLVERKIERKLKFIFHLLFLLQPELNSYIKISTFQSIVTLTVGRLGWNKYQWQILTTTTITTYTNQR